MEFSKTVTAIKCNDCHREIEEWETRLSDRKEDYDQCSECAFISGRIDEPTYLEWTGNNTVGNSHAAIDPEGKVIVWNGSKTPPWQRKKR